MFEARSKNYPDKVACLPGSTYKGIGVSTETALQIVGKLTCMDPTCTLPLQVVRGTTCRTYFRHAVGTEGSCGASSGEGRFHLWGKELLKDAHAQELAIDGARLDVAVKTPAGDLIAVEIQYSPIKTSTVLRRHEAHRKVAAGTIWLIPHEWINLDDRITRRWIRDLLDSLVQTPKGSDGFGCMLGLLDEYNGVTFIQALAKDTFRKRETYRISGYGQQFLLDELRYWAAGANRGEAPEWISPTAAERLDALASERIFYREPELRYFKG